MSVIIKGMEMPRNEPLLIKLNPDGSVSTTAKNGYRKYAAVPVPEHGDLINRDEAAKKIWADMRFPSNLANAQFFVNELREMPTIIPAEECECKVCANADNEYCFACDNGNQFKPMTNADRIRQMTDEELARWIARQVTEGGTIVSEQCIKWWLDWLKSQVEVDG